MTFCLYSIPVRYGNTRFRGQICCDLSAVLEGVWYGVLRRLREIYPFARDVSRPMVANLQNLSEIENSLLAHIGSVLSDMHS